MRSRRVKRSDRAAYFQPSDVVVPGISSGGEKNTWKVEFAVLFPTVDGQAPQISRPVEIIQMLQANKGSIEKAVGATIKRIAGVPSVKPSKEPIIFSMILEKRATIQRVKLNIDANNYL